MRVHRAARAARRTHPPHASMHVRVDMHTLVNMLFAQVACNGLCVSLEANAQLRARAQLYQARPARSAQPRDRMAACAIREARAENLVLETLHAVSGYRGLYQTGPVDAPFRALRTEMPSRPVGARYCPGQYE